MYSKDFGNDFHWGISSSAFQTEGAYQQDGKGLSIWDHFTSLKGKIFENHDAKTTCDFYHRYKRDISIIQQLGIKNFRFSISWPRILPQGTGHINAQGIDFYNQVIDHCLSCGIEPWVTLYHWDLPLALSEKGGWTNREIMHWFCEYAAICAKAFGDRVRHWMILNEPAVFTDAGYFLGIHAPGLRGLSNFLPAVHHAALCQAEGARTVKDWLSDSEVGTTFSCSWIEPIRKVERHINAARRADALINRLFIEPALGLGYPTDDLKSLRKIEQYMQADDEHRMKFDFDFIGLQNYTREVIKHSFTIPYVFAKPVSADRRQVPVTLMNWEVYPEAIYQVLLDFHQKYKLKKIIITENGAAFQDKVHHHEVADDKRKQFIKDNIRQCLRAKREGVPLSGYFVWTLTDNFEWAEGYRPTFGLVHVNFRTQERIIKQSGFWYKDFIEGKEKLISYSGTGS